MMGKERLRKGVMRFENLFDLLEFGGLTMTLGLIRQSTAEVQRDGSILHVVKFHSDAHPVQRVTWKGFPTK